MPDSYLQLSVSVWLHGDQTTRLPIWQTILKDKPAKSNCTQLQGTRKIVCFAHITVKTLTLFQEYSIADMLLSMAS